MIRSYKFRAWNHHDKLMYYELDIKDFDELHEAFDISRSNGVEVMQWTGLKDKHGNLIWEGDILKMTVSWIDGDGYEDVNPVLFEKGEYFLGQGYRRERRAGSKDKISLSHTHPLTSTRYDEMGEVIGNIHEHPELLEA